MQYYDYPKKEMQIFDSGEIGCLPPHSSEENPHSQACSPYSPCWDTTLKKWATPLLTEHPQK